jgi:zinc and cadmium transporter
MIIIGDTIHNFVDGIAIAAAFLVNIPLGIVTALVVGAHEIPQEIGDFGVLLKKGLSRKKVFLINLLSALVSLVGALLTFYIGTSIADLSIVFIAISAGFFLYISLSNLIPEIHHENRRGFAVAETVALIGGLLITYVTITSLHSFLPEHVEENTQQVVDEYLIEED